MKLKNLPSPEKLADYCKAKGIARLELFGSAVGDDFDPEESDIDLLVVTDRPSEERFSVAASACKSLFGLGAPVDLLVCTAEEARRAREEKDGLVRRILDSGRIIYG